AQLAISIVVVATGALFVRSLRKIQAIDPGFQPDNVATMLLDPGMLEYRGEELPQYFTTLQQRVAALPGVRSVAVTTFLPLNGMLLASPIIKEGDPPPPPNQGLQVSYAVAGPHYFETAGTELVRGRDFLAEEHTTAPRSVIVNEEMARRLYGGVDQAMGKR